MVDHAVVTATYTQARSWLNYLIGYCEKVLPGAIPKLEAVMEGLTEVEAERDAALALCPLCRHEWSRHDPADGMCDAHTNEPDQLGVCLCGRDLRWMQRKIMALSTEALQRD